MNVNSLYNLTYVRSEADRRYGLRVRHADHPASSLRIVARAARRRRWEASHERRPH